MSIGLSISELMSDEALTGKAYSGSSWATWRAVLKAAYALPLSSAELSRFAEVAGNRNPPQKRVRELWSVVGRRGGKDSIAALIALHASLFAVPALFRRPGELATVMCLACDRSQASIAHGYIRGLLRGSPLLEPLIRYEDAESITLEGGVEIVVATNSYRAVRGRTVIAAIMDEVAFYRSEDSATPDVETYNALLPGLATTGGMLIGISSPYRRSGLLFDKWRDHFGQDSDDVLVVHGPSRTFNEQLPQEIIDDALARDPQAAAAEWLAAWRSDLSGFLDGDWIDRAATLEPGELPPMEGTRYFAFLDPSGGRSDAMALGIAHRDKDKRVVVDAVRGRRAPFDPASVADEFAALIHDYHVRTVTADRYAAEWVVSAFAERNVTVKPSEKSKSEIYLEAEPLFARGAISIPADRVLLAELRNLERRTHRGGRDSVDHPVAGHDDYANACCGAAWLAAEVGSMQGWVNYYARAAARVAAGDLVPCTEPSSPGSPANLAARAFIFGGRPTQAKPALVTMRGKPHQWVCSPRNKHYVADAEGYFRDVPPEDVPTLVGVGARTVKETVS
jgi:hypothetical protein